MGQAKRLASNFVVLDESFRANIIEGAVNQKKPVRGGQ